MKAGDTVMLGPFEIVKIEGEMVLVRYTWGEPREVWVPLDHVNEHIEEMK